MSLCADVSASQSLSWKARLIHQLRFAAAAAYFAFVIGRWCPAPTSNVKSVPNEVGEKVAHSTADPSHRKGRGLLDSFPQGVHAYAGYDRARLILYVPVAHADVAAQSS